MKKSAPSNESPTAARLYSIGHSNHDMARLFELLRHADVTAVADVRSQPYSRYTPQFNRPELEQELRAGDIGYAFLGDLLGGRPSDPAVYNADGQVNYERVRATSWFRRGIERLLQGTEEFSIVMLCAEEDPLECHRALMIGPALIADGHLPIHIRGDGSIESTADMEERLLQETGVGAGILDGLFAATIDDQERRRLLVEAYRLQAHRKAYRLTTSS